MCILAIVFGVASIAHAAPLAPHIQVDHWTTRDGLPQNSVNDLLQTPDGYVWMATFGGIARFDGVTFRTLTPHNTPGLDAARFTSLALAPDGALWFGSEERGLFRYADGVAEPKGPQVAIWDLEWGPDGVLWAAANSHLIRIEGEDVVSAETRPGSFYLSRLADDTLVLTGRGRPATCPLDPCEQLPEPPFPTSATHPRRWFQTRDGALWIGDHQGFHRWDGDAWIQVHTQGQSAYFAGNRVAWEGSDWLIHRGAIAEVRPPLDALSWSDVAPATIRASFVDSEGGLWLGSDGEGLYRLQTGPARVYPPYGGVTQLAPHPDGGVWASNPSGLFAAGGAPPPPQQYVERRLMAVWGDGSGGILLTNEDEVEWVVDGELISLDLPPEYPTGQPGFVPSPLGPWWTRHDRLWLVEEDGTVRSVFVAPEGWTGLGPLEGPTRERTWLRAEGGVLRSIRSDGTVERTLQVPTEATPRTVLVQGQRTWVGTYGAGLFAFEGDEPIGALTPAEGLCDYAVSRIFPSDDGHLWFHSNRGLAHVPFEQLEDVLAGRRDAVECALVGSPEGNGNAGFRDDTGALWLPTVQGLVEVRDPQAEDDSLPRIHLEAARYSDVDLLDSPTSPVGPGALHVRFAGIFFRDPRSVQFRTRLVGLQDDWSPTNGREVRFENLPPGAYRFEVQARGSSGQWGEPAAVAFTRRPAVSERAAFRFGLPASVALLVLGILGTSLLTARRQNRRLEEQIAERVRAEQRLAAEQEERQQVLRELEAARRLEGLGRLAGGVAHDFNNLLTVVSVHTDLLRSHADPAVAETGAELHQSVERASELTGRLLVFGQRDPKPAVAIDVGATVGALLPMLRRLIRADVELDLQVEDRVGVRMDPGRMDQVVMNLVTNGADAIEGAGRVSVRVRRHEDRAELLVTDDGRGLSSASMEQVFEPYYSTKESGQGTGLGLATVLGVLEEAGGTIDFASTPGVGTTARVRLPEVPLSEAPEAPKPAPEPVSASLRVLLVDDQDAVRRALVRVSEGLGWDVTDAANLEQAVARAKEKEFDLLVTDVVMPGGSGPEVAEAVQALHPGLPVLFISGHTDGVLEQHQLAQLLRKPFTRKQLAAAAAELLQRTAEERA